RHDSSSGGASSTSDARSEVYARASLISLDDFELVTDPAQARRLGLIMVADLLRAYEVIARHCSIPLSGVLDFIEQSGSVSSSQGTIAAATDRLPVAGIVTPDVQHISIPASAPVCGASQPTPSTHGSTGSVDTPNIHAGTDTEGAVEHCEGSSTRPSA
ncbi:hypothetical protein KI387_003369, partial [Taxus chinensis]